MLRFPEEFFFLLKYRYHEELPINAKPIPNCPIPFHKERIVMDTPETRDKIARKISRLLTIDAHLIENPSWKNFSSMISIKEYIMICNIIYLSSILFE